VLRFFGIASIEQWDDMWPTLNVAYRQHNTHEIFPEAVSAWLRQGELQSANIQCQPYDRELFRKTLTDIRPLTLLGPEKFVPKMQKLCAKAGVAVVFVPALPKTGISGATRWLNPNKAIIQLSLRYKTDDQLWFTFFHEAGHIILHGKKELFLEGAYGMDKEKETEANRFAEQELFPRSDIDRFSRMGRFSKNAILDFSRHIGIAPGIIVGHFQHRELLPRAHCNDLKKTFRWAHE
jgi:Zn-dependent peptidase ImmA (M78 family)